MRTRVAPTDVKSATGIQRAMLAPGAPGVRQRIFWISFFARLAVVILLVAYQGGINALSRDSAEFHAGASIHAEDYARGEIDWSRWIDDGWPEFISVVYFLCGKHLVFVLLINAALAAFAAVIVYRIGRAVFHDEPVAIVSAYLFGLFPSIVYYTCLPLKEAAAVFALTGFVWGITNVKSNQRRGWIWIIASLAMIAALRVYLFYVCLGCLGVCLLPIRYTPGWTGIFQAAAVLGSFGLSMWVAVTFLEIDTRHYESLQYFDVEYINHVRMEMSVGRTEMYDSGEDAQYTTDPVQNILKLTRGLYYFFVSIDLMNITRDRQYAAVPEIAFMLYCIPYLIAGIAGSWRRMPTRALPVLLVGTVVVLVYTSAATNMGALYRWRIQAMPFLIMIIVYGAAVLRRGLLYSLLRSRSIPAGHTPRQAATLHPVQWPAR